MFWGIKVFIRGLVRQTDSLTTQTLPLFEGKHIPTQMFLLAFSGGRPSGIYSISYLIYQLEKEEIYIYEVRNLHKMELLSRS